MKNSISFCFLHIFHFFLNLFDNFILLKRLGRRPLFSSSKYSNNTFQNRVEIFGTINYFSIKPVSCPESNAPKKLASVENTLFNTDSSKEAGWTQHSKIFLIGMPWDSWHFSRSHLTTNQRSISDLVFFWEGKFNIKNGLLDIQ